jgi:hypothetical protein
VTSPLANLENVCLDRRSNSVRRQCDNERRQADVPVVEDHRRGERRKTPRRRQIDPTTCERDYTPEEIEFMRAMDEYKRTSGRMFPTCSEVLEVIRSLGYAKPAPVVQPEALAVQPDASTVAGAAAETLPQLA